jgi:ribosome modulation factor
VIRRTMRGDMGDTRDGFWRWDRAKLAVERGRQAYMDGKPQEANPYKRTFWGFGGYWDLGWMEAEADAKCEENMNDLQDIEKAAALIVTATVTLGVAGDKLSAIDGSDPILKMLHSCLAELGRVSDAVALMMEQATCNHEFEVKTISSPMEPLETVKVCKHCGGFVI